MGLGRILTGLLGGEQPSTPTRTVAADTGTKDPDAVEQERLRTMGRAALFASGGAQGVLQNGNTGRNQLLQR